MTTRNIVLTDHQSQVVDHLVTSGRYQNASEVLRAGLRMVEEAEARYVTKINDLRAAIDAGQKDMEAGRTRTFTGDEFATYLSEHAEQAIRKKRGT
ncbi:MAG: type II toxin-antitoxin system ParD family antitoxin [Marinobacter sp.]|uniref:type II toxin-antitoxin system ParD family antitoxin n=1 Tax=Marinobacter sp. TaxID=50741 RepID=UPI003297BD6D